ncbi:MAG: response regulator [Bacillota bacterium]|nr:response regulator [Bacillota bacterium]
MMKIGICDDMPILQDVIESYIRAYEKQKGLSFQIDKFSSGEELINEYENGSSYDLLFLDQKMKELTGLETARQIRKHHSPASCGIVFVTSSDNHYQFKAVQPLKVIAKPVSMETISEVLNTVTNRETTPINA